MIAQLTEVNQQKQKTLALLDKDLRALFFKKIAAALQSMNKAQIQLFCKSYHGCQAVRKDGESVRSRESDYRFKIELDVLTTAQLQKLAVKLELFN